MLRAHYVTAERLASFLFVLIFAVCLASCGGGSSGGGGGGGTQVVVRSISVSPANPTIPMGGTQQFTATGTFSDNSTQTLTSVTWSSSATAVATNSATGLATGVATGDTTITATSGSISGSTMLGVRLGAPARNITWTRQPPTPGWPGYDGWLTIWYDSLSQRAIFYVVTDASSSIYSTDVFFYDSASNRFDHLGGTGSLESTCVDDTPSWPGDRHPGWVMTIDTRRNFLWLVGGSAGACTGGIPPNSHPRRDMYYLQLGANPLLDRWHQVTPANLDVTDNTVFGAMVYDPDDDVLFLFGYDGGADTHDHWVYCRTVENPTPGVLTEAQVRSGCGVPDDWNEVILNDGTVDVDGTAVTLVSGTPFDSAAMPRYININGDLYAIASVTDSRHLVLADSAGMLSGVSYYLQPPGTSFPGLVYDTVTRKMILFGGTSGLDRDVNETWAYDVPSKTWRRKALSTAVPPVNVTTGNVTNQPAMAYSTRTHKILYHQFSNTGAPADWQYDPVTDTWTKLATSGDGATEQQYLAYDSVCNCLVGWSQDISGVPDVWLGRLSQ